MTAKASNELAKDCRTCEHFNGKLYCMEYAEKMPEIMKDCPSWEAKE